MTASLIFRNMQVLHCKYNLCKPPKHISATLRSTFRKVIGIETSCDDTGSILMILILFHRKDLVSFSVDRHRHRRYKQENTCRKLEKPVERTYGTRRGSPK